MKTFRTIIKKLFNTLGYQIVRTIPPELSYEDFVKDPTTINNHIIKITTPKEICIYSTYKLIYLQRVFDEYLNTLYFNFNFTVSPGDVVIDIGAHHGIVCFNFARLGAQVIAYEPDPINFEILKINKLSNPQLKISINNKAVSSKNQLLDFCIGKTSTTGSLLSSKRNWKKSNITISVNAVSFKDIIDVNKLSNVKLMKIDIEGGEYDFLIGTPRETVRKIEYYYIEAHPTQGHKPYEIKEYMIKCGYSVFGKVVARDCFELICKRN